MNISTYNYDLKINEKFKYSINPDIYPIIPNNMLYIFIKHAFQYFPIYYMTHNGPHIYAKKYPEFYDFLTTLDFDIIPKKNTIITTGYIGAKQIITNLSLTPNYKIHIYSYLLTYLYCFLEMNMNFTINQSNLNDGNDERDNEKYKSAYEIRNNNLNEIQKLFGKKSFTLHDKITIYSSQTIKSYINSISKSNIIIYNYFTAIGNNKSIFQEFNHYIYMVIALNTLEIGGTYIFYNTNYSINYIKQITTLLFKYFEYINVKTDETYIYPYNYYFIYKGFKMNITNEDNEILMNILDKWNNLLNGKDNNYSSPLLQYKYEIYNYDITKHSDNFVTNLFEFKDIYNNSTYPCEIDQLIDTLFYKFIQTIIITKNFYNLLSYINDDLFIKYNKDNYNNNILRSVKYCKKYNIPIKPKYITIADTYIKLMKNETKKIPQFNNYKLKHNKTYNPTPTFNKYNINRTFNKELLLYNYLKKYYNDTFIILYNQKFVKPVVNKWNYYIDSIIKKYGLEESIKKKVYSTNIYHTKYYSKIYYSKIPLNLDLYLGFFDTEYNYNIGSSKFFIDEYNNLRKLLSNCINILVNVKIGGSAILEINLPFTEGIVLSVICLLEMFFKSLYFIKFNNTTPFKFTIFVIAKYKLKMPDIKLINYLTDKLNNFDLYDEIIDSSSYNKEIDTINAELTNDIIDQYVKTLFFIIYSPPLSSIST